MSLARFISDNLDDILAEWERFAETLYPAAKGLERKALRDFARGMLQTIAQEMEQPQTEDARTEKARGHLPEHAPPISESARRHASDRLTEGFTLDQLVAEYRALRASVVRRWVDQLETVGPDELEQMTRFNEGFDQSLTYAVSWYSNRLEQARDLFVGALGHDLRTPLGAILNSADVQLRHEQELNPAVVSSAVRIRNSALRMRRMLGALLDFTRTRLGGGLPLSVRKENLATVMRTVVDEVKANHTDCRIRAECTGDLSGNWDQCRLEQLLQNLLENAAIHATPGTPVTICAWGETERVHAAVHNQGAPIPREMQRAIFDPLTRGTVEGRQRSDGLGLGLYIARQIAEAHGGSLKVASSEDQGTTFTLSLPRDPDSSNETSGMV